ncbi:MAG: hypothetical protein ABEK16_04010 [Candidatus Nanohalobium sp.]
MDSEILAGLMSLLTATAGFLGMPLDDAQKQNPVEKDSDNLELGSAHEHAQFFLNVDGKEVNFTQRRFQVRSQYVHLENFKPHIVHKHSENVTWSMFMNTINVGVNRSSGCTSFKGRERCGNLSVVLNGEEANLSSEIQQGDNLAILVNASELSEDYMSERLPDDYTKRVPTKVL